MLLASIEDNLYDPSLSDAADTLAPAVPTGFPWLGLMGSILIFLLILFVSLWIIRRLYLSGLRNMNAPWARVLDRQVLGGQQNLYLVEIAGQLQVLGGSDHHLLKICEINDPVLAAEILEEIATRPAERVDGWLKNLPQLGPRRLKKKKSFSEEFQRMLDEVKK